MQKLWIDLEGTICPVPDALSHEEWANERGHSLESLLERGWVRVQSVPPQYLMIDFQFPLNAAQTKAVPVLFENRFDQVVVEFGGEARSFGDGEGAMGYTLSVE